MEILLLIIGLFSGICIGYLFKKNKTPNNNSKKDTQLITLEMLIPENAKLQAVLSEKKEYLEKKELELRDEREGHDHAKNKLAKAEEALKAQEEKINDCNTPTLSARRPRRTTPRFHGGPAACGPSPSSPRSRSHYLRRRTEP